MPHPKSARSTTRPPWSTAKSTRPATKSAEPSTAALAQPRLAPELALTLATPAKSKSAVAAA